MACISLWPGAVKTELLLKAASATETTENILRDNVRSVYNSQNCFARQTDVLKQNFIYYLLGYFFTKKFIYATCYATCYKKERQ